MNTQNKNKLHVGQTVWLVKRDYRGNDREPEKTTISKIGKKYFELDGYGYKFEIETLREVRDIGHKSNCHLSLNEFQDKKEREALTYRIKTFFLRYDTGLNVHQLRTISAIIATKS